MSTSQPPAREGDFARALCQKAQLGEFDEALAALAAALNGGTGASSELSPSDVSNVGDCVAHELVRRADHPQAGGMPLAVHVLGIASWTSANLVIAPDEKLHLVSQRIPNDDAGGEDVRTACGQQLWSDAEEPLADGMRGSWHAHHAFEVRRCPECGEHASDFPETVEEPDDADLPSAVARTLRAQVSQRTQATLCDDMAQLARRGAVPAHEAAEAAYVTALIAQLAEQARSGGDEVLQRVLMRYYDSAVMELAASGSAESLSGLLSHEDWLEVVAHMLVDLDEDDHGLVARSEVYGELRAVISERILRLRGAGS